ncbi:phage holin family protein [Clostridium sp.]|uniref:phage holin family protein n=1 Tax=Clostridium sp. TaxID=1506 RepID=UPI0039930A4B
MELVNLLNEHVTLETLYYAFAVLVIFDVLTGCAKAWKAGRLKSRTLRDGLFSSIGELLALILCIFVAIIIPIAGPLVFAILIFMILKELTSVIENLVELGAKLPTWLIKGLQVQTDKLNNLNSSQKDAQ